MKKIYIIIPLVILAILIIIGVVINIREQGSPKRIVESLIEENTNIDNIDELLSKRFLDSMREDTSINNDHYQRNLSDYETSEEVINIKIIEQTSDRATATIEIRSTTINKRTKFTLVGIDTYRVSLTKERGGWKIDTYELIDYRTISP